jgi:hypothetical protein
MRTTKTIRLSLLAAITIGSVLTTWSAEASSQVTETFTGKVSGIVNPSSGDSYTTIADPDAGFTSISVGDTWVATYVFDLSQGLDFGVVGDEEKFGGTTQSAPSPLVGFSLVIDGQTGNSFGGFFDSLNVQQLSLTHSNDAFASTELGFDVENKAVSSDLTQFLGLPTTSADLDIDSASSGSLATPGITVTADLTHINISVGGASGAPEPAAWTMLILGFFGIGWGVRISRQTVSA